MLLYHGGTRIERPRNHKKMPNREPEYWWIKTPDFSAGILCTPCDPKGLKGHVRVKVYQCGVTGHTLYIDLLPEQVDTLIQQLQNAKLEANEHTGATTRGGYEGAPGGR